MQALLRKSKLAHPTVVGGTGQLAVRARLPITTSRRVQMVYEIVMRDWLSIEVEWTP
jgi:hypothetical protein